MIRTPPSLVLGTMTFGDTVDADSASMMLDRALDAGVTMIDTANGYAGGESELMLGRLLAGRWERVEIATKAGMPHADAGENPPLSAVGLRASLEGSLRRLGVDHVDLYYLHQPDRSTPIEETLGAVSDLVAEGKIGGLAVSNFAAWQIAELNNRSGELNSPRATVAQQLYNLVARRIDDEYAEYANAGGISTMVYNPLGGGLLSGRHTFDAVPAHGRFGDSRLAEMYTQRYWNADMFRAIDELSTIAEDAGIPLSELALRWLLGRDVVDSILLGASRPEHLEANLAAIARGPLPRDVQDASTEVGTRLRGPMPAYNR